MNLTKLIPFLLCSLLPIGCDSRTSTTTPIKIEQPATKAQKQIIVETVKLYDHIYKLSFKELRVVEHPNPTSRTLGDGRIETVLASGKPGKIEITLRTYSPTDANLLRDTLKHELFHTILPNQMADLFPTRRILGDGSECLGFHGLTMKVRTTSGVETYFRAIEEAAAELCAQQLGPGFVSTAPDYFSISIFMKEMTNMEWVTPEELIAFQKSNGFREFCAKILKTEARSLSDDDIRLVCEAFQLVRGSRTEIVPQLKKIIERRGETGKYQFRE